MNLNNLYSHLKGDTYTNEEQLFLIRESNFNGSYKDYQYIYFRTVKIYNKTKKGIKKYTILINGRNLNDMEIIPLESKDTFISKLTKYLRERNYITLLEHLENDYGILIQGGKRDFIF